MLIFLYHFGADYQRIVGSVSAAGLSPWLAITAHPDLAVWAVSLFVILSGLSFTLASHGSASRRPQYARRAVRILAPLWVIAVPYLAAGLALGEMSTGDLWKVPIWLLGLGVVSPATFFPVSKAWWYVTLALQCALVMPLILGLVRRLGLTRVIALLIVTELASLWLIGLLPPEWHYLRMGLVLARLIEISVGVLAAEALLSPHWLGASPPSGDHACRRCYGRPYAGCRYRCPCHRRVGGSGGHAGAAGREERT